MPPISWAITQSTLLCREVRFHWFSMKLCPPMIGLLHRTPALIGPQPFTISNNIGGELPSIVQWERLFITISVLYIMSRSLSVCVSIP